MRAFIGVILYVTALCGAAVGGGYVALVLGEDAAEAAGSADTRAYFARQAALFTWGMGFAALTFALAQVGGFCWLKGGLANLQAEADPEDLLRGLWIYVGATLLGALAGGALGWAAAS